MRIIRQFDAPPAKVFRAHSDPGLVSQWMGPNSVEMSVDTYDFRTGGSYRYSHSNENGVYGFFGSFHEIRAAELIVQTFTFDGFPDGVALERIVFEDIGDGRTRLMSTSLVDSFDARDGFVATGMEEGVVQGYQRLDDLLTRID